MKDERNIFVIGLNMKGKTPEAIAREAALKIVEITDGLIEKRQKMKDVEKDSDFKEK